MKITIGQLKQLIKEQVEEAVPKHQDRGGGKVDEYNLKPALEILIGATYPLDTLKRRIGLLSPQQQDKIAKLHKRMELDAEAIDNILSSVGDTWP